jgi:hypothetical protein
MFPLPSFDSEWPELVYFVLSSWPSCTFARAGWSPLIAAHSQLLVLSDAGSSTSAQLEAFLGWACIQPLLSVGSLEFEEMFLKF